METGPSLLPEPSSYALTAIRSGTIFGLLFAILFSLVSASQKELFGGILLIGLFTGLFGGLSFGLIWASFFKGETATVEVGDKKVFVSRLNIAMYQLGYNPATQTDDFFSYKPSFRAGLAAGRISVQLQDGQAVVVGPKMYVNKLLFFLLLLFPNQRLVQE